MFASHEAAMALRTMSPIDRLWNSSSMLLGPESLMHDVRELSLRRRLHGPYYGIDFPRVECLIQRQEKTHEGRSQSFVLSQSVGDKGDEELLPCVLRFVV